MNSIFNSVYILIFIKFLRTLHRKLLPAQYDGSMPRYLILAMFNDKALLLGYSDSYTTCQKYSDESTWAITFSTYTGSGYADVNSAGASGFHRNPENTSRLESLSENVGCLSVENDMRLARKYGFSEETMDALVRQFRNGNYV